MEAYAGIDLHSSNSYIGIIDEQDQRQFGKRLPNSQHKFWWHWNHLKRILRRLW